MHLLLKLVQCHFLKKKQKTQLCVVYFKVTWQSPPPPLDQSFTLFDYYIDPFHPSAHFKEHMVL